jgi:hypothetical protein
VNLRTMFDRFEKECGPIIFMDLQWGGPDWPAYTGSYADCPKETLDREYDDGFGGQECPDYWLWSDTHVGFVHEYDGSTWTDCAPRNPTPLKRPL